MNKGILIGAMLSILLLSVLIVSAQDKIYEVTVDGKEIYLFDVLEDRSIEISVNGNKEVIGISETKEVSGVEITNINSFYNVLGGHANIKIVGPEETLTTTLYQAGIPENFFPIEEESGYPEVFEKTWFTDLSICGKLDVSEQYIDTGFFVIFSDGYIKPDRWMPNKQEFDYEIQIVSIDPTAKKALFKVDNDPKTVELYNKETFGRNALNLYLGEIGTKKAADYVRFCAYETPERRIQGTCEAGCIVDTSCLPIGTRYGSKFCGLDNVMVQQALGDIACVNNYECESNLCIDGQCVSPGLWKKMMNWFAKIFGMVVKT